jgi:hypothetical protein
VYFPVIAAALALCARWLRGWWLRWKQSARERRVHNWPTVTASIEVPAVIEDYGAEKKSYSQSPDRSQCWAAVSDSLDHCRRRTSLGGT